jgi:hypothetical protein
VAWVYDTLQSHGSIEYARRAALAFAEGARRALNVAYAGATSGGDMDFVRSLLDYMVNREV